MTACNAARAHLYYTISLVLEYQILCSSPQFTAITFELQDQEGFKLPLCQSTNRLHQRLQRYQGKIRHILVGSVEVYQTLGSPGDFSLGSTTACAENAYPLYPFSLCVGLFHSGDIPMVVICMKGISHLSHPPF